MKIKRLVIENFKSIERIELIEPNPFTVFVGPNGSGKSNIFEALELFVLSTKNADADRLFLGPKNFIRRTAQDLNISFLVETDVSTSSINRRFLRLTPSDGYGEDIYGGALNTLNYPFWGNESNFESTDILNYWNKFYNSFSRIFVGDKHSQKIDYKDNFQLSSAAANLEKVLKRILMQPILRNEIFEWLELFVPEFKSVEVVANPFSGEETLLWHEHYSDKPFTKNLISDGTYNILALLTAVYQSDEPQFLCIEEPENGLHPQVLMTLVDLFRQQCEEKGHYIWLNTHSESLVRCLTTDEIILINKKNGATKARQIKGRNIYDIPTDQAWLTGALGGGLPW